MRESNSKLLAEIGELRKKFAEIKVENDELKDKNIEIPELRRKFTKLEAEKAEFKARIAEVLKQGVEENKRHDAMVEELEQKNTVLEARLAILEQGSLAVDGQSQNDSHFEKAAIIPEPVAVQLKQHIPDCETKDAVSEVHLH